MEENPSSTTLIDISRYCSSFADADFWSSSSQSTRSRSPPSQRLFSPTTTTRSSDSDSPILPSLPLPPTNWSLTSSFAQMQIDPPILSTLWSSTSTDHHQQEHRHCNCCRCSSNSTEKFQLNRQRPRSVKKKEEKSSFSIPTPIQRPSATRRSKNFSNSLTIFDDEDEEKKLPNPIDEFHLINNDEDDDDGTLRLHVSNIPFTWSKEKLAEVFGKYGTTFDVEVVYNERGSKGFGFVTFLAKKDALEAKRRMDREIVDGRRLVVNFAKPKQKSSTTPKETSTSKTTNWKSTSLSDRSPRPSAHHHYQSLGFSTPPTARRQHLSGFSSLSSTPTRSTTTTNNSSHQNYQRYYL